MINSGLNYDYDEILVKVAKYYHTDINNIYNISDYNNDLYEVEILTPFGSYKDLVNKELIKRSE